MRALLLLLLAGCAASGAPTVTHSTCVRSHVNMQLMLVPQTNCVNRTCMTTMHQQWIPVTHCDQEIRFVMPNPDYAPPAPDGEG